MKELGTYSKTKEILEKYDLAPKKMFGQNFIIDPSIVNKIASKSCFKELVTLEIGPGLGALTKQLLKFSKKVIAYEIDKHLFEVLKNEVKDDNLELFNIDFLKADLSFLKDEEIVVCANLPYYITTPILFKLVASGIRFKWINVMMQKEVGLRIKAKPNDKDYGSLSVIMQYLFDVQTLMKIPKEVFYPRPKIDSVVLNFMPKKRLDIDEEKFFEFVNACFKQRRKTLWNNLKDFLEETKLSILSSKYELTKLRAQQMSLADFLEMYEYVRN